MDNYYDTQLSKITEWIKLFLRMHSIQKIKIFTDPKEIAAYLAALNREMTINRRFRRM